MARTTDQLRRELEGREQQLGAQHPVTLSSVHTLAGLLRAQGRLAEAEPLVRRCAGARKMAAARGFTAVTKL